MPNMANLLERGEFTPSKGTGEVGRGAVKGLARRGRTFYKLWHT